MFISTYLDRFIYKVSAVYNTVKIKDIVRQRNKQFLQYFLWHVYIPKGVRVYGSDH